MNGLRKPLTLASLFLAVIGLAISVYLSYVHYNPDALVCGAGNCDIVQASQYSKMFGIPIALLGVAMFLFLIAGLILREKRPVWSDVISTGILIMLIAAVLYWAYLTYLELNVIHAICQWCVATSIVTVILLVVEGSRWYQGYKNIGIE